MTKKSKKYIAICGTIFMWATGSLMHFIYAWSGNNPLVGIVSAMSESVWEHNKLFILPLLIVAIVEYIVYKNIYKLLWAKAIQLVFMITALIAFFYTYTGALGIENFKIDISLFIIIVVFGQFISYKILNSKSKFFKIKYVPGLILVLIYSAFAYFSFNAPNYPVFISHSTNATIVK